MIRGQDFGNLLFRIGTVGGKCLHKVTQDDFTLLALRGNLCQLTPLEEMREDRCFIGILPDGGFLYGRCDQLLQRQREKFTVQSINDIKLRAAAMDKSCVFHLFQMVTDRCRCQIKLCGELFNVGVVTHECVDNVQAGFVGENLENCNAVFHVQHLIYQTAAAPHRRMPTHPAEAPCSCSERGFSALRGRRHPCRRRCARFQAHRGSCR